MQVVMLSIEEDCIYVSLVDRDNSLSFFEITSAP